MNGHFEDTGLKIGTLVIDSDKLTFPFSLEYCHILELQDVHRDFHLL